jgi:hypothetical protein
MAERATQNNGRTANLRPFRRGQSGNPGGRPRVAGEFRERCQEFMSEEGWERLVALTKGNGPVAFHALELICRYAYGKPPTTITGAEGGPVTFTLDIGTADVDQQLEQWAARRAAQPTSGR